MSDAPPSSPAGGSVTPATPGTWLLVLPWELSAPGGVSQVVQNLFDATQRVLGHRSLLLVNTWDRSDPSIVEVDGRRTVQMMVPSPTGPRRPLRHLLSFLFRLPSVLPRLRRLVHDEGVTRINVHYPGLDALAWVLLRPLLRHRPELVLSFHGSDLQDARAARGLGRHLWKQLLHRADDITVCSGPMREEMLEVFGAAAGRSREVLNGVDPAWITTLAKLPPREQVPARFVLSLATIEHKKGLDTLIDAFARLADRCPDLSLVLAGRVAEPACFARLQAQAAGLACAARIHFLTNLAHEEAMRVLARAQVLVLASRKEPFGIVVLEAGVLGVPVVATTACGVVSRLGAGEHLLAVPPDEPAALAEAVDTLLSDARRARRLAAELADRVAAEFTWERVIAQYERPQPRPAPPLHAVKSAVIDR